MNVLYRRSRKRPSIRRIQANFQTMPPRHVRRCQAAARPAAHPDHPCGRSFVRRTRLHPAVAQAVVGLYVKAYRVDLNDCEMNGGFASFDAFFTRPLRDGARPLRRRRHRDRQPRRRSPRGRGPGARAAAAFTIKGQDYSVAELVGDPAEVARATRTATTRSFYLSPRDYHRVHAHPSQARSTLIRSLPGDLYPVNAIYGERHVESLFSSIKHAVSPIVIDTERHGRVTVVMVAAIVVGRITVSGVEARDVPLGLHRIEPAIGVARGDGISASSTSARRRWSSSSRVSRRGFRAPRRRVRFGWASPSESRDDRGLAQRGGRRGGGRGRRHGVGSRELGTALFVASAPLVAAGWSRQAPDVAGRRIDPARGRRVELGASAPGRRARGDGERHSAAPEAPGRFRDGRARSARRASCRRSEVGPSAAGRGAPGRRRRSALAVGGDAPAAGGQRTSRRPCRRRWRWRRRAVPATSTATCDVDRGGLSASRTMRCRRRPRLRSLLQWRMPRLALAARTWSPSKLPPERYPTSRGRGSLLVAMRRSNETAPHAEFYSGSRIGRAKLAAGAGPRANGASADDAEPLRDATPRLERSGCTVGMPRSRRRPRRSPLRRSPPRADRDRAERWSSRRRPKCPASTAHRCRRRRMHRSRSSRPSRRRSRPLRRRRRVDSNAVIRPIQIIQVGSSPESERRASRPSRRQRTARRDGPRAADEHAARAIGERPWIQTPRRGLR